MLTAILVDSTLFRGDKMTENQEQQLRALTSCDNIYQELLFACQKQEKEYLRIKNSLPNAEQESLERYIALCEELEYRRTCLAFHIK